MSRHPQPSIYMEVHGDGESTVVRLRGMIDLSTAPLVGPRLLDLAGSTTGVLVVDLAQTSFLDCRGLAVLAAARDLAPDGSRLRVRGARGVVRRALTVTDLRATIEESDHEGR